MLCCAALCRQQSLWHPDSAWVGCSCELPAVECRQRVPPTGLGTAMLRYSCSGAHPLQCWGGDSPAHNCSSPHGLHTRWLQLLGESAHTEEWRVSGAAFYCCASPSFRSSAEGAMLISDHPCDTCAAPQCQHCVNAALCVALLQTPSDGPVAKSDSVSCSVVCA